MFPDDPHLLTKTESSEREEIRTEEANAAETDNKTRIYLTGKAARFPLFLVFVFGKLLLSKKENGL